MDDLSISDGTLAALAQAGEVEALIGLLERYRPSLYASAIKLLRDRDDADDAVQETYVGALVAIGTLRDPGAVGGWLHTILRNVCLGQRRRSRPETPGLQVELAESASDPEQLIEHVLLREWLWEALDRLNEEDRATVMLRYLSRCHSYEAIAAVTGVPVGTVRSRLHRSRAQLSDSLRRASDDTAFSWSALERARRAEWEAFYEEVHAAPVPTTYRDTFQSDVEVSDSVGHWYGIDEWSAHEREAIGVGVRARINGLVASRDLTILEIDFINPDAAPDHCPPRSTFVHHLTSGRSHRLSIHYV